MDLRRRIARHPVLTYFLLAYAISWSLWLPLIASVQGWWQVDMPECWHFTGAVGPISAAVIVASATEGGAGRLSLLRQYRPTRGMLPWLAFVVFGTLVLLGLGIGLARIVDGHLPSYSELSRDDSLPELGLPLSLIVNILSFGVGEETGWRGFALPNLQRDRTAIHATNLVALGWGLWHLPAFFENEAFMDMTAPEIAGWAVSIWMGAVFLTWLYNSSYGSLIVVALFHGMFNQFTASQASSAIAAVLSMGVIFTAIVALRLAGPKELTGVSRRGRIRHRWVSQLADSVSGRGV